MFGRYYVIEHCLSEWRKKTEKQTYQIYVADTLQTISENTSILARGKYVAKQYSEIIHPKPKDTRTGAEIAADVIKNAGLTLIRKEEC